MSLYNSIMSLDKMTGWFFFISSTRCLENETGTITHRAGDNNSYYSNPYADQVDSDFDPTTAAITEIRVKVNFTANTQNNQSGVGPKAQSCFAGDVSGEGTYYCSAWSENLNGSSGTITFTINETNIRTYAASGDGTNLYNSG
jgi:hypothetical protein